MKIKQEWIEDEQDSLDEIKKELNVLNNKWFKRSRTWEVINFLKEYIKMKEKFIDELMEVRE